MVRRAAISDGRDKKDPRFEIVSREDLSDVKKSLRLRQFWLPESSFRVPCQLRKLAKSAELG